MAAGARADRYLTAGARCQPGRSSCSSAGGGQSSRSPWCTTACATCPTGWPSAKARALLQVPYLRGNGDSALRRLGLADDQAVVHQAAGMVSAHCHCSTGDALALLRARAFADGQPVGQVAHAVVHHGLRLD